MAVTLRLPADIARAAGVEELLLEAHSADELARRAAEAHPEIRRYLFDSSGRPRPSMAFYTENRILDPYEQLADGSVVEITFAISGG
ncbi:MAG TPA: hypothetical protein VFL57_00950 [Bryobacteraceae bacterium]|nr:hypothetical protein [Bryobacteraceae bacterium]